ncbi:MAG: D-alanine--D-alanine ligase [Bacillati bacterium ANGP1]|uniref:D-alanine--D-alanine ligase n=1 Tax=Candidatus Segetimicrobium genomatis TaxID=2569760 RepID=A0A537KY26_9BACT|nr:MAG: D-alanine--D-alanine ligase [Terrabacteria group bacterium ANGP1]
MTRLRIAVLMGGPSPERDVSMSTGREIVAALDPLQYDVLPVEITKEGHWLPRPDLKPLTDGNPHAGLAGSGRSAGTRERGNVNPGSLLIQDPGSRIQDRALSFDQAMTRDHLDVAFIAMHGPYGEDGTVQGLLELLGVPYTGSGVLASALAMDKLRSRQLFEWHRIPVPGYLSVTASVWRDRGRVHRQVAQALGYPCVVKPNAAGSSIGVSLVREPTALAPSVEAAFAYGPVVLIEEYVSGTEITCGIIDDPTTGDSVALPLIEVVPHAEFYNYQAKYAAGGSEHIIPARVSARVAQEAGALALRAYQALGCEGMSRVDMIARGDDVVVLEVNTIPGMTATSLLPDAAKATGIKFPELLDRIIRSALRRSEERKRGNLKSADR